MYLNLIKNYTGGLGTIIGVISTALDYKVDEIIFSNDSNKPRWAVLFDDLKNIKLVNSTGLWDIIK